MRVVERYSHLNGVEFLLVRRPRLWQEVIDVIESIDVEEYKATASDQKSRQRRTLYSPGSMAAAIATEFKASGWRDRLASAPSNDVRGQAGAAGLTDDQSGFAKDRVALEIQFGKFPFVLHDLFGSPLALFVLDLIDVGVEVLPVKALEAKMASGGPCFERSRSEIVRSGRGVPAVPLVLLGVAP